MKIEDLRPRWRNQGRETHASELRANMDEKKPSYTSWDLAAGIALWWSVPNILVMLVLCMDGTLNNNEGKASMVVCGLLFFAGLCFLDDKTGFDVRSIPGQFLSFGCIGMVVHPILSWITGFSLVAILVIYLLIVIGTSYYFWKRITTS
jgi:hypothetical protein